MVIDDEQIIVQMIAGLIEDAGHRALVASDGRDALHILEDESEPPALLISDIMMPHLNGVALTRELRANPRFEHVPIVLMSAASQTAPTLADHFIPKPFDFDELDELIERYAGDQSLATVSPSLANTRRASLPAMKL